MNPYVQQAKVLFNQDIPPTKDAFLRLMYCLYGDVPNVVTEEMSEIYQELHSVTQGLAWSCQDAILSAVNALCATYERTAFMDGLAVGANLIFRLIEEQVLAE